MRQENPEVLEQMKLEQMVTDLNNAQESGDGMEEDLETDQSLEAKIEREVKRVIKSQFTQLDKKIEDADGKTLKQIIELKQANEITIDKRIDQVQEWIREVHKHQT